MNQEDFERECQGWNDEIQREYERRGDQIGWAFLITPQARLLDAAVAIVGLNPGGKEGEPAWDCAEGNAFFVQRWAKNDTAYNKIQVQIHALHALLGMTADETLVAELVPFRSESWEQLSDSAGALAFGRRLWTWVLQRTSARTFICMGKTATEHLADLLGARWQRDYPTGWGEGAREVRIHRHIAPDGRVVVNLPHPSHFALLGRSEGQSATAEASIREAVRSVAD